MLKRQSLWARLGAIGMTIVVLLGIYLMVKGSAENNQAGVSINSTECVQDCSDTYDGQLSHCNTMPRGAGRRACKNDAVDTRDVCLQRCIHRPR